MNEVKSGAMVDDVKVDTERLAKEFSRLQEKQVPGVAVSLITHEDLVRLAVRWLRNQGCRPTLNNKKPQACVEHADAIGWLPTGESIVVECKMSQADCCRDYHKRWRFYTRGMGYWRYFMVPESLEDIGVENGAGLLVVRKGRVYKRKEATPRQDRDFVEEIRLLRSHCDRVSDERRR